MSRWYIIPVALLVLICATAAHADTRGAETSRDRSDQPERSGQPGRSGQPDRADDSEMFVEVELRGGLSPFRVIRYRLFERGRTAIVAHEREIRGYTDILMKTALLTRDEAAALWKALEDAGLFQLAEAPRNRRVAVAGGPTVSILATNGDRRVRETVLDPLGQPDPRWEAVVDTLRTAAVARAGGVGFRDVFHPPEKVGWLDLRSVPEAEVILDGRPIGQTTPLFTWELPAGVHIVTLRNAEQGIERRYDFKVQAGMTTLLELDLR